MPEVKRKVGLTPKTSETDITVETNVQKPRKKQKFKTNQAKEIVDSRELVKEDSNDSKSEFIPEKSIHFANNFSDSSLASSGLEIVPVNELRELVSANMASSTGELVPCGNELVDAQSVQEKNDEGKDLVLALPEGWPMSVNQPWRRRSCELTKSISPCIRKATNHLHHLQDMIDMLHKSEKELYDQKCQRPVTSVSESSSLRPPEEVFADSEMVQERSTVEESSASIHGRRIRWFLSSASLGTISEEQDGIPGSRLESSASGAVLEVRGQSTGLAASIASLSKPSTAKTDAEGETDVLGWYAILDEVLSLLSRMESDRLTTEQALAKERDRVLHLGNEIDRHAYKRMQDLPVAVQREHEACAIDINELRWHCAYKGRIESRITEKVRQAENRNAKLRHDLVNIQKHCPLVEEKLDLEGEAMSSIQDKQNETDDELRQTLERLAATERKTAEANGKATQERLLIKQDVDVVRNELNAVSDELAQLKMYFTSNTHTMNDIRNTLTENAEQATVLENREVRIKALEATQNDKVQRLREKIAEQEGEHHRLLDENNKLRKEKEVTQVSLESDITKLEFQIRNAGARSRELLGRNKTLKEERKVINKKIEKWAKQKISDEKAVKRAEQELVKVDEQIKVSEEETKKVEVLHTSLRENLASHQEEVLTVEESLKTTADSLKKHLKDEAHARTVLQARIASDSSDLVKTQADSKKKREKATQRAEEIEKLVKHVREQVAKLEKIHNERQQTIAELNKILEKVALQHQDMESKLRGNIAEIRPNEAQLKKENLEIAKKIDHMTWKSEMMDRKMQDMDSSTTMMNKVVATTKDAIAQLNEDISELKIQLETGCETERDLKTILEQTEARFDSRSDNHVGHMADRKSVLTTNQKGVEDALRANKALATEYNRLQGLHLREKASLLTTLEKRVNEEGSLKDHRELRVLQGRMREALQYYYRLRGLKNRADLAQFELRTAANGDRLVTLQSEMMRVIEHISRFLEANNAAHSTISFEAAKVAQTPLASASTMA